MEKTIEDFFEAGDCMAVFAGKYLGSGKTVLSIDWQWHELRRDDFLPPQAKQLQVLRVNSEIELNNGERLWDCLSEFDRTVFTDGAVLDLFPIDCRLKGYRFERVFFKNMKHHVCGKTFGDKVKLCFTCEKAAGNTDFFTRLPVNSRPAGLPESIRPDLKTLLRSVGILLSEKLDVIFDRTLAIDHFMHDSQGFYSLELVNCKNWNSGICGVFELKLTARFPMEEKFNAEQKLYDTANFLNEYVIEIAENTAMLCQIKELDFSGKKNVSGKTFSESSMLLQLSLI